MAKMTGLEEVLRKINKVKDEVIKSAIDGINESANDLLIKSQAEVPVQSGKLKASAKVDPATIENTTASVNYNTDYAVKVHEISSRPKFLERPYNTNKIRYESNIANKIRKALK